MNGIVSSIKEVQVTDQMDIKMLFFPTEYTFKLLMKRNMLYNPNK